MRITSAERTPQNNTRCCSAGGMASAPKMATKMKTLSTESDFSTRYAVRNSVAASPRDRQSNATSKKDIVRGTRVGNFTRAAALCVLDTRQVDTAVRERLRNEVERRRSFAIISHPDAGKTTLTEKLLLHGGAIHLAG